LLDFDGLSAETVHKVADIAIIPAKASPPTNFRVFLITRDQELPIFIGMFVFAVFISPSSFIPDLFPLAAVPLMLFPLLFSENFMSSPHQFVVAL